MLFDGEFNGQPRKLLAQASRNGWFFVLDRTNGKNLISSEFVRTNWTLGRDAKGQPIPIPLRNQTRWRPRVTEPGRCGKLASAEFQSRYWSFLRQHHASL